MKQSKNLAVMLLVLVFSCYMITIINTHSSRHREEYEMYNDNEINNEMQNENEGENSIELVPGPGPISLNSNIQAQQGLMDEVLNQKNDDLDNEIDNLIDNQNQESDFKKGNDNSLLSFLNLNSSKKKNKAPGKQKFRTGLIKPKSKPRGKPNSKPKTGLVQPPTLGSRYTPPPFSKPKKPKKVNYPQTIRFLAALKTVWERTKGFKISNAFQSNLESIYKSLKSIKYQNYEKQLDKFHKGDDALLKQFRTIGNKKSEKKIKDSLLKKINKGVVDQLTEFNKLFASAGMPSSLRSAISGKSAEVRREKGEPKISIRARRLIYGVARITLVNKKTEKRESLKDLVKKEKEKQPAEKPKIGPINPALNNKESNSSKNPALIKNGEKVEPKKCDGNKNSSGKYRRLSPYEILKNKVEHFADDYLINKIHSSDIIDKDGKELLLLKIHDGKTFIELLKKYKSLRLKAQENITRHVLNDLGKNYHVTIRGDLKGFTTKILVGNERMRVIKKEIQEKAAKYLKPILQGYKNKDKHFKTYVKTIIGLEANKKKEQKIAKRKEKILKLKTKAIKEDKSKEKKRRELEKKTKQEAKKANKSAKAAKASSSTSMIAEYRKKLIAESQGKKVKPSKQVKKVIAENKAKANNRTFNMDNPVESNFENLFAISKEFVEFFGNKLQKEIIEKETKALLEK